LLKNGAGTRGWQDNERILVVVQVEEASERRKNGGEGSFAHVSTRANRVVAERSAHRIGQTEQNLNMDYGSQAAGTHP